MKSILEISLVSLMLLGCQCASDLKNVKSIPGQLDLKGVYYPDKITKDEVIGFSVNPNAVLIFDTDSTFVIDSFPASALDFDDYYDRNTESVQGHGTWSLYNDGQSTDIHVSLHYTYSSDSATNGGGTTWKLVQKNGEYYIYYSIGDPDECNPIRLRRK